MASEHGKSIQNAANIAIKNANRIAASKLGIRKIKSQPAKKEKNPSEIADRKRLEIA